MKKNPVYSMGGGSACAGFASKKCLLTWNSLMPVLPAAVRADETPPTSPSRTSSERSNGTLRSLWVCAIFQVSSGEHELGCEGQGQAAQVGEEPERGTKPPSKGRGQWKALSADYQAESKRAQQKKELRAQINQRPTSKIRPGQSFPSRA